MRFSFTVCNWCALSLVLMYCLGAIQKVIRPFLVAKRQLALRWYSFTTWVLLLPCHCGRYRFIHLLRAGAPQNNGSGTVFKYLYSLFWGLKKSLYFDFSKCCFWILYISERERERESLHLNLISFMYYFQSNSCSKFCIYTHPVNTTVVRQKYRHTY